MIRQLLTEQGVRDLYKEHLGRDVESLEVLANHLKGHRTLDSLRATIFESPEYLAKNQKPDIWGFLPKNISRPAPHIDVHVSPDQLDAIFARIADEWAALGKSDAHWSVVTNDRYRAETFAANEEEFYRSGRHVAALIEVFSKRNGITIPREHVLELGCGTGRVTTALADLFSSVTAVDVSPGHLELCRAALQKRGKSNATLRQIAAPQGVCDLPECSFFLSTIVLQHNPPPLIAFLLAHTLAKVRPGGAALFQVPTHTPGYEFRVKKYLASPLSKDFEMHCLPMNHVFALLHENGFVPLEVIMDTWTGMPGSHTFFAVKPATAS